MSDADLRKIKDSIIEYLFETSSHCSFCGPNHGQKCGHQGNRTLNEMISADVILSAITAAMSKDKA